MHQYLICRIGRHLFALPSRHVKKATSVLPHLKIPLLKPFILGLVFYNKQFIYKIALDSLLDLGLYKSFSEVTSDATLVLEINETMFCATVNDVNTIATIEHTKIKALSGLPENSNEFFPNKKYLSGYFEQGKNDIYIINLSEVHHSCFQNNLETGI
ncbi:CheW protein [Chloroherpeton thalassium ATCC 35110]|uniref:CheW protein n=1 Tax=Chloroherpeton thalassium (strain ATCC 35110 / GB-78) TaxID=517418 RepID=B3QWP7_CHLT3|nr:chemotaxis protein CheW [Chloroherpeton thalassium]ACF14807.1 CheW protein [Chloroherpeton thalassium ATCC 35110]